MSHPELWPYRDSRYLKVGSLAGGLEGLPNIGPSAVSVGIGEVPYRIGVEKGA